MADKQLMIYGAYGYTGELIARQAVADGLKPVLSGRNGAKVGALAQTLGLAARPFDLARDAIAGQLADIDVVLHCAGPFSATAQPMIEACIATGTHYLDITGEIGVFEYLFSRHQAAADAGSVICSGVGFDVVPTDCVAACLAEDMPDATELALGFDSRSGFSPGTAKTTVEGLADGGKVRREGHIQTVPLAADRRRIDFGNGEKDATTIPWGDVSTAYHSTGIANISVYMPMPPARITQMKRMNWVRPLLGLSPVQSFLKSRAAKVAGPDAAKRERATTHVWGEVRNAQGSRRVARIHVANGYTVTVHASLVVARHLLNQDAPAGGAYTPSMLMGRQFVEQLPGSEAMILSDT